MKTIEEQAEIKKKIMKIMHQLYRVHWIFKKIYRELRLYHIDSKLPTND